MVQNPPLGWPRIVPHLIYDDAGAAVEWLSRTFGFHERRDGRHTSSRGVVERTQMDVAGSIVTLGRPSVHGGSPNADCSTMLYVYVDDVDVHFRNTLAAGAQIVSDLANRPWGDRCYQVADLEGHQWTFAQHVRDAAPEECAGGHELH